ncbi:DUF6648 family protein [Miniphocaeibacter halophilus]|uniref:Uncharacterized protein n=1 Tax=Miniphocaeibacter halophilus TaxID=2931922 RepID=A0AC61MSS2_9FIRM|nr:DUF6648 family protein [Miniphocaeibacter halophilus]QQK07489.1 hypothetical protein JFY71_09320 [Miniphocaeibacter halophilus]
MKSERELLNLFIQKRNDLIDQLDKGKINKEVFLENNYALLDRLSMKPFLKIDTVEKGIYNYQYYNILAKYHNNLANKYKEKDKKRYKKEINKTNNYYYEKDRIILEILELVEYKNIDCYFIEMHSNRLNNNLFEIILNNYEKTILHSMNTDILNKLKRKGVFNNAVKKSKIDLYVNSGI